MIETVSLMRDFPLEEKARDRIRAEILDMYVLRACQKAKRHMVSMRCERGDHRCHNSGITCLCICHDRKEVFHDADRGPGEDRRDGPHRQLDEDWPQTGSHAVPRYS